MATLDSMKKELVQKRPKTPAQVMNATLNSEGMQKLLEDTVKENRGSFVASLIDLYGSDTALAACNAGDVVKEALKAVSLKLPINKQLGFAYIIPYGGRPQFQLGYRGYIQLCIRTGTYKYINTAVIYEGEYLGEDKLTGEVDVSGQRVSDEVIGYTAYIETINGFKKCLYWTKDKVKAHAKRFSKTYANGNGAIWKEYFDEMAQKTVLRNLLSKYGIMSVELQQGFEAETPAAEQEEAYEEDYLTDEAQEIDSVTIDPQTGEVELGG